MDKPSEAALQREGKNERFEANSDSGCQAITRIKTQAHGAGTIWYKLSETQKRIGRRTSKVLMIILMGDDSTCGIHKNIPTRFIRI